MENCTCSRTHALLALTPIAVGIYCLCKYTIIIKAEQNVQHLTDIKYIKFKSIQCWFYTALLEKKQCTRRNA